MIKPGCIPAFFIFYIQDLYRNAKLNFVTRDISMGISVKIGTAHYENNVQGELMFCSHDPVPDSWYVNEHGKAVKVHLLMYREGRLDTVITNDLDGSSDMIKLDEWYELHLSRYCYAPKSFGRY